MSTAKSSSLIPLIITLYSASSCYADFQNGIESKGIDNHFDKMTNYEAEGIINNARAENYVSTKNPLQKSDRQSKSEFYHESKINWNTKLTLTSGSSKLLSKANSLLQSHKYLEAIEKYDEILSENPTLTVAYFSKGYALFNLSCYKEAIVQFDRFFAGDFVNNNLKFLSAHLFKGIALQNLGQNSEALTEFDSILALKQKIDDSILIDVYRAKGESLFNMGEYTKAIDEFDKVISKLLNTKGKWLIIAYCRKGDALFNSKRYDEAINIYDMAIDIDHNYNNIGHIYSIKGRALILAQRFNEAHNVLNQAIAKEPDNAENYLNNGLALEGSKHYQKALLEIDKALKINPNSIRAYVAKGVTLNSLAQFSEAIIEFDNALELDPGNKHLLRDLALTNKELAIEGLKNK